MSLEPEKPRVIIVAGPNGSGKTTITERGLAHEWFGGCEYINADVIASDELKDNSETAIRQAATIAAERRNRCLSERRSLAIESVFSGDDKVAFLRSARQDGFFVRVFFVSTRDPTTVRPRSSSRPWAPRHWSRSRERGSVLPSSEAGRPMGSKLSDRGKRHDTFYKRARQEGFAARSVFKLEEIDRRYHLLRKGSRVLDLGCRPGSWLQYAARVSEPGQLVGVDRTPLDIALPTCRVLVGDVFGIAPSEMVGTLGAFDVVLSDMAPDTSGVRSADQARSEALFERALWIAEQTLAPGGHFVGKLFQGPDFQKLIKHARQEFTDVRTVKPEGSRKESIEQYVVALGRKRSAT